MKADVEEEVKVDVVEEECKAEVVEKQEKGEDAEEHEKVVEDTVVCLDNDSQEKVTARVVSDVVAEIGDVAFPEAESIEISEHPVENDIKAVEVQNDAGEAAVEAENVDEAEMVPESIVADDAEVGEQLESNAAEEVEVDQQPESVSVEEATEDRGAEVETQASSASDEIMWKWPLMRNWRKRRMLLRRRMNSFQSKSSNTIPLTQSPRRPLLLQNDEDSTFSSQSVPTLVTTTTHSGHIITGKTFNHSRRIR
ncbi:hypothetical protein BC829DRAFT_421195 [Chytridium lagenaria]|nr:hypothetical protein BC829DRAFT_421195 [Chytridium lagenaria]